MRFKWTPPALVASVIALAFIDPVNALSAGMTACLEDIKSTGKSNLTTPSSPTYNAQRFGYDRNFDYKPVAIYYPATNADAAAAIQCAASFNISVAPRSGGHSFEGYSVGGKDGSLVIDLSLFQQFSMDQETGIATVGAGTRLGPLYVKLWNSGQYLIASGTCPLVGIGGIALGGGVGMAARKYGMTTQNVVGMTLIDARGDILKVNSKSHSDLFWALRGAGGGSFGLVTEFQIQAYKAPPVVSGLNLTYSLDQYRETIHAFGVWGKTVTDDLYSGLLIYRDKISLLVSFLGPKTQALKAIEPFLTLAGQPQQILASEASWYQSVVSASRGVSPENPDLTTHRYHRGRSLVYRKPMSEREMDIIYKYLHTIPLPKGGSETHLTFELWGGKINQPNSPLSVFDYHRGVIHSVQFGVQWNEADTPADEPGCPDCLDWSANFAREMQAAYSSGPFLESYQNYMERDIPGSLHAYYGHFLPCLKMIKKRVDPNNVFSFPQSIPLP